MITHTARLDATAHLDDINAKLDARKLDEYHKAFDSYNDDLDRLAGLAFDWARKHGTARIHIDYADGNAEGAEAYFLKLDGKPTLINANGTDGIAAYLDDAEDLAAMMCYEYATITITANAA